MKHQQPERIRCFAPKTNKQRTYSEKQNPTDSEFSTEHIQDKQSAGHRQGSSRDKWRAQEKQNRKRRQTKRARVMGDASDGQTHDRATAVRPHRATRGGRVAIVQVYNVYTALGSTSSRVRVTPTPKRAAFWAGFRKVKRCMPFLDSIVSARPSQHRASYGARILASLRSLK